MFQRCLWVYLVILAAGAASAVQFPKIELVSPVSDLTRPVYVTHAADDSDRLFIVEQPGRIRIIRNGTLVPTPFLDIDARVRAGTAGGNEQGLLGLAFPPGFHTNQHFYVYYFAQATFEMILSRFQVSTGSADVADSGSEEIIMRVPQPAGNHNGGHIAFGADGYLYLAPGDGGDSFDEGTGHALIGNAQTRSSLLGKMLRIDVETPPLGNTYMLPTNNPYISDTNTLDEIWALGLRNPYRFSFDRYTHDLYIGDVGQNEIQEIDYQPASSPGGENYGWRRYEADDCLQRANDPPCDTNGLVFPVVQYDQISGRCAVTGGYVHRASPFWSFLHGTYLYADYCTGEIAALKYDGGTWHTRFILDTPFLLSGFGEDEAGNVYVCHIGNSDDMSGIVYQLREVVVDNDNDNMPDSFEVYYGFDTNSAADAALDFDGDKLSNLEELLAGTDPTNALSNLRIDALVATGGTIIVEWTSEQGRFYSLKTASNMVDGYSTSISNVAGTPPMNTITDAAAAASLRLYSIELEE